MKFFIDTANVEDIKKANDMGVICGVTTNPSILKKAVRNPFDVLIEIRDSGALKNNNFKEQAATLSKQIENGAKNIFDKYNTPENQNLFQQIWNSIVNFISHLFG